MSSLDQSAAELVSSVRQLIESHHIAQAEELLRDRIFQDPLSMVSFGLLAEVRRQSGRLDSAKVAEKRFRQLQQISANSKPARAAECFDAICDHAEDPTSSVELHGHQFAGMRRVEKDGQLCAVGPSLDGRAFLKIEVRPSTDPSNNLDEELTFLEHLSDLNCQSSAGLLKTGMIDLADLGFLSQRGDWEGVCPSLNEGQEVPFMVASYIRADQGGFGLADVILALLEQQKMGIFQNGLILPNIRFDSLLGVCRLTDYRNALRLEDSVRKLEPKAYLDWCREREAERCAGGGAPSFFEGRTREMEQLFEGDSFLLVRTQLFGRQLLADVPVPSIQEVRTNHFILSGSLRLEDRTALLETLEFKDGERVLDLGCGSGGISRYLAERDCRVTGVDCDERSVIQANSLANSAGLKIRHLKCDLEYDFPGEEFDTVLALGVLPHISNRADCAVRIIASGCQRILVECAAHEPGYRWQGSLYHPIDNEWRFENAESLNAYLLDLFPEFKITKNLGGTASERVLYLLERENSAAP